MMIPDWPATVGVRFDTEQIDDNSYGLVCWRMFWRAIQPESLKGASLFEGDTAATLWEGTETVFCIALQSGDPGVVDLVKEALSRSDEFQRVAATPPFAEGAALTSEPLPDAAQIDDSGELVAEGGDCAYAYTTRFERS